MEIVTTNMQSRFVFIDRSRFETAPNGNANNNNLNINDNNPPNNHPPNNIPPPNNPPLNNPPPNNPPNNNNPIHRSRCPICLCDLINGHTMSTLCGHLLCHTCWLALLQRGTTRCVTCNINTDYGQSDPVFPF